MLLQPSAAVLLFWRSTNAGCKLLGKSNWLRWLSSVRQLLLLCMHASCSKMPGSPRSSNGTGQHRTCTGLSAAVRASNGYC